METDDTKKRHDAGAEDAEERRPTHAESARSLLVASDRGVLSTLDRRSGGPYGSLVEFAGLDSGDALFLLSDMAAHTTNFKGDERASLFVSSGLAKERPLAVERATLMGVIEATEPDEAERAAYFERHPHAEAYVGFSDFGFWRLRVEKVRYIGGFGRMSWVRGTEHRDASPDPLARAASGAVEHMNEDHADALLDYVRAFSDIEQPSDPHMVALDRFGFDVRVRRPDDRRENVRVEFGEPLTDPSQVRTRMVDLLERARKRLTGD